jgi:hypothetical protein
MTEKLLQYIWQFQYFNHAHLQTSEGEILQILYQGQLNTNEGPDFSNARIKINETILIGSVELHVKASDWLRHQHQNDKNYSNVILHVVYENDMPVNNGIPVLELESSISAQLLERYSNLMATPQFISCSSSIHQIRDITFLAWKERLLAERLTRKAQIILGYLATNKQHWEESFWWLLAKSFGGKVNAESFETIAQSIPINLLAKHKQQIHQIEALLFGQAGLLNASHQEAYPQMLFKEYSFLKKKYRLQSIPLPIYFLRMRPGNFPTIRLAQLAMLIHHSSHLFSRILEMSNIIDIKDCLQITANDYWHYHYRFDEPGSFKPKRLGEDAIDSILINTVIPALFAYGINNGIESYKERAVRWLSEVKAEVNVITKGFASLSINNQSAFDSQALIELKNEYCNNKRCLQCAIGNSLLKNVN